MRRTLYIAAFTVLALGAALLTLRAQHTITVVVASHDVPAGVQIQSADVQLEQLHDDGLAAGALTRVSEVVGRYVAWPLAAGEPVLARMVQARRSGSAVLSGLGVPDGYRAIAVPVQPAAAVGGVLARGDRVDVYATPTTGHESAVVLSTSADAGQPQTPATGIGTVLLGRDVLVLELRTDQGLPLDQSSAGTAHGLSTGVSKLGSVVLAVPSADVDHYAAAVAGGTIYLALGVG